MIVIEYIWFIKRLECQSIFKLNEDSSHQYALRFLSILLSLKEDSVINVRLFLGTFIYQNLSKNSKDFLIFLIFYI